MSTSVLRSLAPRLRPTLRSSAPPRLHILNVPSTIRTFATSPLRSATGTVSQQPGSKTFKDMGKNAKEEAQGIAQSVGDAISGASPSGGDLGGLDSIKADLGSIGSLGQKIPSDALLFGAAGLLPYAGTSLGSIYLARQAGIANALGDTATGLDVETSLALLHHVQSLQIQYGAIILSFLGAIHWGLEFASFGGQKGMSRYLLGIAPVMVGWGSMLLPGAQLALIAQWFGFNAMWFFDQKATGQGWAPKWYSTYRFGLTAFVGSAILLSLGGTSYYGPGSEELASKASKALHANTSLASSSLEKAMEKSEIKLETSDQAFTKFTDMKKVREEKEAEDKKKAEEEQVDAEKRRKAALANNADLGPLASPSPKPKQRKHDLFSEVARLAKRASSFASRVPRRSYLEDTAPITKLPMPYDISDLDPFAPTSSPRIFQSTPQPASAPSRPPPPPPPPLPTSPVAEDPLSSFSSLMSLESPSTPSELSTRIEAHQARQEAVLHDLQRTPFAAPLTSEPQQLAESSTSAHPLPMGTPTHRSLRHDSSASFSPPRRLSGLMASPSSSPPLNRTTSNPTVSSPPLSLFHPSSPPPHAAEFAFRRTASHSGLHPHHVVNPTTGVEEDIWSDFQSGGVPHAVDPLKMAWAARGGAARAATVSAWSKGKERTVESEPWKQEWTYDSDGADAVQPITLVGVRDGVHRALDEDVAEGIRPNLPPRLRISTTWTLLYSLDQHGISIGTMYERMRVGLLGSDSGVVIVVKDSAGSVFGAYVNEGLRESKTYYGDGSCFLWKSTPFAPSDFRVGSSIKSFKWTGKNSYLILSESNYLSVGGGDGKFGLWIDGVFEKGFTATCPAFDNEPLTSGGWEKSAGGRGDEAKFEVVRFECWAVAL